MRKAIFEDPYEEEDDDSDMLVGDVFAMQKSKMIENQIISDETNNMFMEDLFIIKPNESTTKEEHVKIEELIMKEQNELVAFKEDGISMQTFNFID